MTNVMTNQYIHYKNKTLGVERYGLVISTECVQHLSCTPLQMVDAWDASVRLLAQ